MKQDLEIELEDWDYTCGDGCCYLYGTRIIMNGEEVPHPLGELEDNSYIGSEVELALEAVLKKLGYNVKITRKWNTQK